MNIVLPWWIWIVVFVVAPLVITAATLLVARWLGYCNALTEAQRQYEQAAAQQAKAAPWGGHAVGVGMPVCTQCGAAAGRMYPWDSGWLCEAHYKGNTSVSAKYCEGE